MARTFRRALLVGIAGGLLSGCAGGMVAMLDDRNQAVELQHVPFHAQITDQCGPAALATVLNDAGVAVSPEALKARVYIPGRQGALQVELLAAARQFDRIPYEIDPSLSALLAELDAGRPVLVLQNLGATIAPIWHYAVVVGYLPEQGRFVLRSGDRQRHLVKKRTFVRSWKRGEFWGMVILQPGALPTHPDADRYLRAVAAAESTGGASSAAVWYRAATKEWPKNSLAWLGLGNAFYAEGDLQEAESAWLRVLEADPGNVVAMNNLAQAYIDMGCPGKALALIESALQQVAAEDPVRAHVVDTHDKALQSEGKTACQ